MKTKHTTGEWVAKPNPSDSKKHGIWSHHPTRGTSLIAMAQKDFMTEKELKANAKLIANAPKLLEALSLIAEGVGNGADRQGLHHIAVNAIKKATN